MQRGRAVESRSSTVRRRQSATGVGCGHHTLRGSAVSGCRPECGCGPAPVSTRRGPQPGGLAVCCANRCRGRGRHHRRSTGSGMGPAVDRNRSRRGSLGYHRYCGYADSPARSHTPSCGAAARATSPCADGATTGTTAPGGAACAAVPGGARPGGRAGQTSAAVAERSRRHRGPRRAVATWPSLCLGRNGAQPVRLFRFGPVGLRPGGCSPGSHHLSTDQRGDPGAALTGPAGRSGLPAPRARAAGDRQQSGRRGAPCGRVGSGQLAGQQRADSATAEWQIIAQSDGQDEKVEPCRSKPGLR
ncbi:putative secreted protein P60-related protein [Mycobacterium tuberculosis NCGM2209]|nr:putative secreted protein P60-related protein [Mycobacterium tuberculosis NCGM2209]